MKTTTTDLKYAAHYCATASRIAEILESAADLFGAEGRNWIRGCEARNRNGDAVDPRSKWARSWCLRGAVVCAADLVGSPDMATLALDVVRMEIGMSDVAEWNDTSNWASGKAAWKALSDGARRERDFAEKHRQEWRERLGEDDAERSGLAPIKASVVRSVINEVRGRRRLGDIDEDNLKTVVDWINYRSQVSA